MKSKSKKNMKKAGQVEGGKGNHKHFAKGGKVMTPSAPMSGAGSMKDRVKGSENN